MRAWGNRPTPGMWRDSWGGWTVMSVTASTVLYSAVSTAFDGRADVVISTGRVATVATGRYGSLVTVASLGAAVLFVALALSGRVRRARVGAPVTAALLLLVAWGVLTAWLRGDGQFALGQALLLLMTALAVVASPPTPTTLSRLSLLRDLVVVASFGWSVANPLTAQAACRSDKCGLFGSLWYGLFPNENSAGAVVAILLPTLLLASPRRFRFSVTVGLLFVAATGSRTAIGAALVAVTFLVLARRGVPLVSARPALAWRVMPLGALAVSLAVFLGTPAASLTGRGSVYAALRPTLSDGQSVLIGAGPGPLTGLLDGWVNSAHGEGPNDLVMFGVPGLLLLALALVQLVVVRHWSVPRVAALGLLVTSAARFPTEGGLMLGLRSPEATVLLLVCGLFAVSSIDDDPTVPPSRPRSSHQAQRSTRSTVAAQE